MRNLSFKAALTFALLAMLGGPVDALAYTTVTTGPNAYCPQPVTPMTAGKYNVLAAIGAMQPVGDTLIDLGLVWGWRMLSPRWQGMWGGEMNSNSLPQAYNTPHMSKVVILLTDGVNTIDNAAHGAYWFLKNGRLGTTDSTTAVNNLNARMTQVCTSMKKNGIIVYTIALGNGTDPSIISLLQQCATDKDHAYNSPDPAQLQNVFATIAGSLSKLRVAK